MKCSDICRCVQCKNGKEHSDAAPHGRGAPPAGLAIAPLLLPPMPPATPATPAEPLEADKATKKPRGKKATTSGVFTFQGGAKLASVKEEGEGENALKANDALVDAGAVKVEQQPISVS